MKENWTITDKSKEWYKNLELYKVKIFTDYEYTLTVRYYTLELKAKGK